ncbi:MAG: stage III sporulation protein AF [Intestinibacter sp.]
MIHIKNWIICILIGAFIVNIVDMVLPESKLKPYINLVCNFIFICANFSIVSFLSSGDSLEDKLLKSRII